MSSDAPAPTPPIAAPTMLDGHRVIILLEATYADLLHAYERAQADADAAQAALARQAPVIAAARGLLCAGVVTLLIGRWSQCGYCHAFVDGRGLPHAPGCRWAALEAAVEALGEGA